MPMTITSDMFGQSVPNDELGIFDLRLNSLRGVDPSSTMRMKPRTSVATCRSAPAAPPNPTVTM